MILCPNGHENPDGATYCATCQSYIGGIVTTEKVTLTLEDPRVTVMAGAQATADVVIATGAGADEAFTVVLQATSWTAIDNTEVLVPSGGEVRARITFRPPPKLKVLDPLPYTVTVTSKSNPANTATAEGTVTVLKTKKPPATIEPPRSRGSSRARHVVTVENFSDVPAEIEFNPLDSNGKLDFAIEPATLMLDARARGSVAVIVRPREQLSPGDPPAVHRFHVDVRIGDVAPITLEAEMEQRAAFRVPWRWVAGMASLIVLAVVLVRAVGGDDDTGGKAADTYAQAVLKDAPVAYWRFEETAISQGAADASGNGLDGSFHGEPKLAQAGALSPPERALRLDGVNDWVQVGGAGLPALTGDFTVEAWVKITGAVTFRDAILGPEYPAVYGDSINFDRREIRLYDRDSKSDMIVAQSKMPSGTWVHWAIVRAGDRMSIYRDGDLDATSEPPAFTFSPKAIGHSNGLDGAKHRFLGGMIDELAIYDRALPASRIRAHVAAR